MINYLIQGLVLGLAYVAPIGNQNLYVINAALGKSKFKAYQTALITVFFDISLALSCFFGIGALVERLPILKAIVLLVGGITVIIIGVGLIKDTTTVKAKESQEKSALRIAASCFAVTWLNPQALIDGSLLLGGMHASIPGTGSAFFILGVCMASFCWFNGITTVIYFLSNKLESKIDKIIKWLNRICGAIIVFYGIKLIISFVKFIMDSNLI